jgi:hypothetical protein
MEHDVASQLQLPGCRVKGLPALGEPRLELPVFIVVQETLIDLKLDKVCLRKIVAVGIEAFGRRRRRPPHHVLRPRGRDKTAREQRKGNQKHSNVIHGRLPPITGHGFRTVPLWQIIAGVSEALALPGA